MPHLGQINRYTFARLLDPEHKVRRHFAGGADEHHGSVANFHSRKMTFNHVRTSKAGREQASFHSDVNYRRADAAAAAAREYKSAFN